MAPLLNFFKYNNVVPVVISLALLGAGGAYAATNPDAIYSQQQKVLTVDNTYIVNKDLSTYTPTVHITGVSEDATSYTVSYTISTIDVADYAWKDVVKPETMIVDKVALNGNDLGVYVTNQLKNVIANELTFLQQVQDKERAQVTQETVATTYGGLVGQFLDSKTETLPGYVPVVTQAAAVDVARVAGESTSTASITPPSADDSSPTQSFNPTPAPAQSTTMSIQILGNNPAQIELHSTYSDLGAVVIDPLNPNLGYRTYLDGVQTDSPSIDTSKPATFVIEYRATDQNGIVVVADRTVLVGGGAPISADSSTDAASTATSITP